MIVLGLDSHGVLRIRDSLRSSPRWCVGTVSQKRAAVLCRASPRVLRWRGVGCCRAATARVRCWRRWACLHTRTSAHVRVCPSVRRGLVGEWVLGQRGRQGKAGLVGRSL